MHSMLGKYPIIALTGPRQSGKTTLLKTIFPDFQYVSLENPDNRNFAETDPNGFLKKYQTSVILDEVQRVPSLFSYIQTLVDDNGLMGQFILSGSQNFHLMQNISQSLAGRVAIFKLFPFDIQELRSASLLQPDYLANLVRGFYPAIYDRDIPSRIFYSNYVQTYLQRDVSELISIKDIRLFQHFLGLCAARAGQLLNMNALANECGISQPTSKSWISALENSYIIFTLQPFHENFSKRIVKTPKLYFYDTGLLCYLLKISNADQILTHPFKGSLFENMMISEYVKRMYHKNTVQDIWFWRDSAGHEVDLIVQEGLTYNLIEFKSTQTVMPDLFKGFQHFEQHSKKENLTKTLVYAGADFQKRTVADVLPWMDFGK
jgi:predicted AAA+ superfamily ATPase